MAEKTMKEMRDEIATRIYLQLLEAAIAPQHHPVSLEYLKACATMSFSAAEEFIAARYDQDAKKGSRTS